MYRKSRHEISVILGICSIRCIMGVLLILGTGKGFYFPFGIIINISRWIFIATPGRNMPPTRPTAPSSSQPVTPATRLGKITNVTSWTLAPPSSWQRSAFPLASGTAGRCPAGKSGVTVQREASPMSFGSTFGKIFFVARSWSRKEPQIEILWNPDLVPYGRLPRITGTKMRCGNDKKGLVKCKAK